MFGLPKIVILKSSSFKDISKDTEASLMLTQLFEDEHVFERQKSLIRINTSFVILGRVTRTSNS